MYLTRHLHLQGWNNAAKVTQSAVAHLSSQQVVYHNENENPQILDRFHHNPFNKNIFSFSLSWLTQEPNNISIYWTGTIPGVGNETTFNLLIFTTIITSTRYVDDTTGQA